VTSRALLLELLLHLLTPDSAGAAPVSNSAVRPFEVRNALDELAQEPFASARRVRDRLGAEGRCYDHQARLFRAAYGVTPLQYVNARRMERAKNLLRDTAVPVAHISRMLGFRDPVYFNRLFRKVCGVTPGTYRQVKESC